MSSHTIAIKPLAAKTGATLAVFAIALIVFAVVNHTDPASGGAPAALDARAPAAGELRIAELQDAVAADPTDPTAATLLGDAYYLRARETGDPSFYSRAERGYDAALAAAPGDPLALTGAATLALARHDFDRGLALALDAHRAEPGLLQPYPAIVDGQVELGRYGAAARTLERFVSLKPNLAGYTRVSYLRELHGDLAGALAAMRVATSAAAGGESLAFVQTQIGGLQIERGNYSAAEGAYRTALAAAPDYAPALAGLARADAARGRLGQAITGYREVIERLPLPEYAIALAEAELAAGRDAAASRDLALVEVEVRLLRRAGIDVDVELALFEADHGDPGRAVELARGAWREAPSVRSADALAWALHSDGRARDALAASHDAMRLGSADPTFLYHAGVIAADAGREAAASALLGQVAAQSPSFSPYHGPQALTALEELR